MPARRKPHWEQNWVALEWGWAWPNNRRVLYNRASAYPDGKPWSERKRLVWWDEAKREWTGYDTPDFIVKLAPSYRAPKDARGKETISGADPFIMQSDGKGWLYVPAGLEDGPLPTHYEPEESVIRNPLYGQQCNPMRMEWKRADNPYHRAFNDPRFPYVFTTYRLTEHHTAGGMSRWLTWLSELQPELFCEVSPELAAEGGLTNGGWATIRTARAEIETRVLVTPRVKPLRAGGRVIHQIGLPYHYPTESIQFGELDQVRDKARQRVNQLHERGLHSAYLYGESADSQPGTEGLNAFFLLLDKPEVYNLPPDPVVPTKKARDAWHSMAAAAAGMALAAIGVVLAGRK